MADAIVIGSGPNGLVAANVLVDAGWEVLVIEEQDVPGGAVRSDELIEPGFTSDIFSAFYPLAVASPAIEGLHLEDHGLRWRRSETVVAHPAEDGSCPILSTDLDVTAASLDAFAPGDGDAWRRLYGLWLQGQPQAMGVIADPFPPLRSALKLAAKLGPNRALRAARVSLMGMRRFADERFRSEEAGRLMAGNALHADLMPEQPPAAVYGFVLCALGQQLGYPVPEGGAGQLATALIRRLRARGGEIRCGERVSTIVVRRGRASGVALSSGERITATRAVLADVDAPQLYRELLPPESVPRRIQEDLRGFQLDSATVKVDWSLDAPIPWSAAPARDAGTVHVADSMDYLTRHTAELSMNLLPARPYLVLGQYAPVDPTRMPEGKEVAWAYTHVPQAPAGDAAGELSGSWEDAEATAFAERVEREVERLAPGFRKLIRKRNVLTPPDFAKLDRNLVNGALNGGTSQLHQQALFRPLPASLGRPETPVRRLFLCSASIHPGGGVHGICGAVAARAALLRHRAPRAVAIGAAGLAAAAAIRRGPG